MKCRTCDETDPEKFYESERRRRSARCKECMKQYVRDRYNHDKMRDWHMRYNYNGFGVTDFNAMALAQNGVCACCGNPPSLANGRSRRANTPPRLFIDHDHVTGTVRGLLCNDCNMAFGYLHEDPKRILDLLAYALKHQPTRNGDSS
jgi:hypothetical protein